jgi:signal transduction histidine kinase
MQLRWMIILLELFFCGQPFFSIASTNQIVAVDLTNEERQWILEHPTVRVGITPEWAPFSYFTPDGRAVGIDIDVLNLISERTGLKFKILQFDSWDNALRVAKTGELDLVTGIAKTPEREKFFQFTRPYYQSAVVIVSRENDHRFTDVSILRNAVVAMPRKHITTLALRKRLPSVRMILTDTQPECFALVANKKADATVVNLFIASHFLNNHPTAKLQISGAIPEFDFPLRLGVRRDHTLLPSILDKALGSISQREFDDITSRQLLFGLQGTQRAALMRKWIIQILIAAAVIGSALTLWNCFLRKEIRARRKAEADLLSINRSLEVFSHSISHDLRGPLRAIINFAELLKEDYDEKLDAEGRDYIDRISSSAARMGRLVNDVLAYGQATRSEFPLNEVSLKEIIAQLIGEFPEEQRAYFEVDRDLPNVWGNSTLLAQCIANLLSNAVKFVSPDRTPHVRVWAERDKITCKLWVEDNGIGIAPEDRERIFKAFERVKTTRYEGTGLGLAIVAKAMERMNGKAGVESELGKGSRFWIQIPLSSAVQPEVKPSLLRRFFPCKSL